MVDKLQYREDTVLTLELFSFLLGDYIGSGIHRDVYEYPLDDKYVIKVENKEGWGENWAEFRIWQTVKGSEYAKWFAESTWISSNGRVLMQRKTKPIWNSKKKLPEKIPHFFTDIKEDNFGWIGNQLVCHDYSFCLERMISNGGLTKRMQKLKF